MRPLTERQIECLRLTPGMNDKMIARALGISEPTVKKHIHEACQRLGVNSRKAAWAALTAMESNVPDTSHPMAPIGGVGSGRPIVMEGHDGTRNTAAAALDVGGSGDGVEPFRDRARDGALDAGAPVAGGPGTGAGVVGDRAVEGSHERGVDRGVGGRFGYQPPPGGRLARLFFIVLFAIVSAVAVDWLTGTVAGNQRHIQAIDQAR